MDVECDECGETFHSYTAHNGHECDREETPTADLFAYERHRNAEREHRRGNRWLERHGYL